MAVIKSHSNTFMRLSSKISTLLSPHELYCADEESTGYKAHLVCCNLIDAITKTLENGTFYELGVSPLSYNDKYLVF